MTQTHDSAAPTKEIDPALLKMLVCPLCKEALHYDAQNHELISPRAGLAYPIIDGVPYMVPHLARKLEERERARF